MRASTVSYTVLNIDEKSMLERFFAIVLLLNLKIWVGIGSNLCQIVAKKRYFSTILIIQRPKIKTASYLIFVSKLNMTLVWMQKGRIQEKEKYPMPAKSILLLVEKRPKTNKN